MLRARDRRSGSRRRLLLSCVVCFAGIAGAGLSLATPANAGRAYGAFNPFTDLLTFEMSDSGRQIRAAAMRVELECPRDFVVPYAARFTLTKHQPRRSIRNRGFLIATKAPAGAVRYRIWGTLGTTKEYLTLSGTLTVSRLRARSARVRLVMRSFHTSDPTDRCTLALALSGQREPGALYVGSTDDDEPVWVRRQGVSAGGTTDSIEWLSGFGAACEPRGAMQGIHQNAVAFTGATFGWPMLVPGFMYFDYEQAVQLSGELGARRATGTFRIVGSGGPDKGDKCDTGTRRWTAVST